jgi:hypothetical protein
VTLVTVYPSIVLGITIPPTIDTVPGPVIAAVVPSGLMLYAKIPISSDTGVGGGRTPIFLSAMVCDPYWYPFNIADARRKGFFF